jgi:hypothetical protein
MYHGPGSRHRSLPRVQIYRVMYPLLQWTRGAAEGVRGTVYYEFTSVCIPFINDVNINLQTQTDGTDTRSIWTREPKLHKSPFFNMLSKNLFFKVVV